MYTYTYTYYACRLLVIVNISISMIHLLPKVKFQDEHCWIVTVNSFT